MKPRRLPSPQALARRHREMLVVACLVVVLSFVLKVREDERVHFTGLSGLPLPPTCMTNQMFGVRCPGCGLTRSFVSLAHGDWLTSWRYHRIGWVLALAILLQFPYRLLALQRPDKSLLGPGGRGLIAYLFIALLIGNWLFDVFGEMKIGR